MKKRLLALALTLVMVFSMFGASLSASAVAVSAIETVLAGRTPTVELTYDGTNGTYLDDKGDSDASNDVADYEAFAADVAAIISAFSDVETKIESDKYLYNYDYKANDAWTAFKNLLAEADAEADLAVANEKDDAYHVGTFEAIIDGIVAAWAAVAEDIGNDRTISAFRANLIDTATAYNTALGRMNAADYAGDGIATAISGLQTSFGALSVDTSLNSAYIAWILSYEAFIDGLDLADVEDRFDKLDAAIAKAEAVLANRDEYQTTPSANRAFTNLEKALDAAYKVADDYAVTNSVIDKAWKDLVGESYNFTTGANLAGYVGATQRYAIAVSAATWKAMTDLKAIAAVVNTCVSNPADKCYGDALAKLAFTNAYGAAVALTNTDTESAVLAAMDALEAAMDGLTKVPAKGSIVAAIEEWLVDPTAPEVASGLGATTIAGLVEEDFKALAWENFEKAMAQLDAAVTEHEIEAAKTAVQTAITGLKSAKVSTREAKAAYNAAKAAVEKLLTAGKVKETAKVGKTAAAISALETAYTNLVTNLNAATVSQYNAAAAALTTALDAFNANKVIEAYEGWTWDKETGWSYYVAGEPATGWIFDEDYDAWYYMDEDGIMANKEWIKIDGTWYWLKSGGAMAEAEWELIDGVWYYFKASGAMVSGGWMEIGGVWYYFYESGAMAANTTIDGYKVNASGAWVK